MQEELKKNDMDRLIFFMEFGEWNKAKKLCDKLLEIEYKNAELYLIKLMIKCRTTEREKIVLLNQPLEENKLYKAACRYGDKALNKELLKYAELQKVKKETFKMTGQKVFAGGMIFLAIALLVAPFLGHEILRSDSINYEIWASIYVIYDLLFIFEIIVLLILTLVLLLIPLRKNKLYEQFVKANSKLTLNKRLTILKKNALKKKEKTHRLTGICLKYILPVFLFLTVGLIVLDVIVIPLSKYKSAMEKIEAGDLSSGCAELVDLGNYKKAREELARLSINSKIEIIENAKVGDIVYFGTYEQDGNQSNGAEVMEWLVLEKQDDRILVLNKYIIDKIPMGEGVRDTPFSWESSPVREWLNIYFFKQAFSAKEQTMIPEVELSNESYTDETLIEQEMVGENTVDRVFLLSSKEVEKYLPEGKQARFTKINRDFNFYYGSYYLRTSLSKYSEFFKDYDVKFYKVDEYGIVNREGRYDEGVRPAMWIDISKA